MHIKHKIGTGLLFGAIASVSGILGFTQNTFAAPANPGFKDDNLYTCVVRGYNAATSSSVPVSTALTDEQLAKVTSLTCLENVADTTGFEKLTGLDRVTFSGSTFTSIDFSNSKPTSISITGGNLANITLGTQPNLTDLELYKNNLAELDLSGTTALSVLSVANNKLSDLALPKTLTNIYVYGNNLTEINLVGNPHFTGTDGNMGYLLADDIKVQVGLKTVIYNGTQYAGFSTPAVIFGVYQGTTQIVSNGSYTYAFDCPISFGDAAMTSCIVINDLNAYPGYVQLAYQRSETSGSDATGNDPTKTTYKLIITPSEEDLTPSGGSSSTDQKGPGTPNTGFFGENGLLITIPVGIIAAIAISLAAYYYGYKRYTGRVHFGKGPLGKKF